MRLYHAIPSDGRLHRILFLMGLFTAQGQSELSCTRRDEFDLDAASFAHRRKKTGQKGKYWLPPELVTRLRAYFKAVPLDADGHAFLTREGRTLVSGSSDAVRQAFDDWKGRAKVDRHGIGFYGLRRFFGDYAKRNGGAAAFLAALAHAPDGVGERHYSGYRDFEEVEQVGRQLHDELVAAGMFTGSSASVDSATPSDPA